MYTVCGYDKDNDVYEIYLDTKNFDDAKQLAEVLSNLVLNGCLYRRCSDGSREPIDWIDVVDTETNEIVYWTTIELIMETRNS